MALDAINEFWKKLTSDGIDVDVGSTFEKRIDPDFWTDRDETAAAKNRPAVMPPRYELRERRTQRMILYCCNGDFFCRVTEELAFVAVPETPPS